MNFGKLCEDRGSDQCQGIQTEIFVFAAAPGPTFTGELVHSVGSDVSSVVCSTFCKK